MLSGSSAGSKGFTASVIQELGHVFVHGIAVRPGHPVIMKAFEEYLPWKELEELLRQFESACDGHECDPAQRGSDCPARRMARGP